MTREEAYRLSDVVRSKLEGMKGLAARITAIKFQQEQIQGTANRIEARLKANISERERNRLIGKLGKAAARALLIDAEALSLKAGSKAALDEFKAAAQEFSSTCPYADILESKLDEFQKLVPIDEWFIKDV